MSAKPKFSLWGMLKARPAPGRRDKDLGDMGIAFGLDAAMSTLDDETRLQLQARDATDPAHPWENRPTRPARL